jgi:hypothetical protein
MGEPFIKTGRRSAAQDQFPVVAPGTTETAAGKEKNRSHSAGIIDKAGFP